jgi:uncharacterized protein (TIGR02270 family)
MKPPVIPAVLSRHAEEAAFLWLLRDRAVGKPQYALRSLFELDQRVEAHIDGLRVAGEHGWQRMWREFEARPEPGEAFAAAVLAFESYDPGRIQQVLALSTSPKAARAIVSAIGWLNDDAASIVLPILTSSHDPFTRRLGIAGFAVRRSWPGWALLEPCVKDRDPQTSARAIRAIGEFGYLEGLPIARGYLKAPDLKVRFAAAWTVTRMSGDAAAIAELQTIAMTEPLYRRRAATMAVRRLDPPAAHRWIAMLGQTPGCERGSIQAAGAYGDPAAVPRLLDVVKVPAFARLAGESFSGITGARLADMKLDTQQPQGYESGPNEDSDDPSVDLDPDDGLDWPDPEKVNKWWVANRDRFRQSTRYLCGLPIARDHLRTVLQKGYQRERMAAALELGLLFPREPLYQVRAPAWRQRV